MADRPHGFKGAWLALWLQSLGAEVHGFSAGPVSEPSLYEVAGVDDGMAGDVRGDVRSKSEVRAAVARARPEVVIHMAAQALVRRGLTKPVETFTVNVTGTAKVLEALRAEAEPRAVVVVTSDKCYRNDGRGTPVPRGRPARRRGPLLGLQGRAGARRGGVPRARAAARDRARRQRDRRRRLGAGPARRRLHARRARRRAGDGARARRGAARGSTCCARSTGYLTRRRAAARRRSRARAWNFGPAEEDARPVGWVVEQLRARWPGELRGRRGAAEAARRRGADAAARLRARPRAARLGAALGPRGRRSTLPCPGTPATATGRTCATQTLRQIAAYERGDGMSIGIVGLGYVGLPLAVAFAEAGEDVIGVDVDAGQGRGPARGPLAHRGHPVRAAAARSPSGSSSRRARSTCTRPRRSSICVPTPLNRNREPDLGPLLGAAQTLAGVIAQGPARRARVDDLPRHDARAPRAAAGGVRPRSPGEDFALAFSPERVDPGRTDYTLRNTPKVVGGLTPGCTAAGAGGLRARLRRARAGLHARGRRAGQAAGEHLPLGQHRARQRAGDPRRPHGDRHLGGRRRRRDQAVRLHALRARARGWAATACRSTRST